MKNQSIRIACLQLEAMPYQKHSENKEKILRLIKQASESKAKLIVLPECVYPCYFLAPHIIDSHTELSSLTTQFLAEIKIYAKKYQVFIAIGLPEYNKEKNALYNSAYLIDDNGEIIGITRKSFLWHFDNIWFQSASQYPVFDTKIGKIGIFICADGRVPEIVRCLALQGAEILLDLTNLVTNGLEKESWSNPQIDYMLPTRALENKVWIVAANKVGIEEKSIQYCGKSSFFSPEGETVTMASTDREEILIEDINPAQSHNKEIASLVNIFEDRHPELYSTLTSPTLELPIINNQDKVTNNVEQSPFASIIQTEDTADIYVYSQKLEYFFQTLQKQEVNIFCFSENNTITNNQNTLVLNLLKDLTKNKLALCSIVLNEAEGTNKYKTIFLIQSGEIIGKYRKTHLELPEKNKINPGKDDFPVYNTNFGTIGMMLDYEGYFPEIARILTLKGAQIIIWPCQFSRDEQLKICQTRSAENKIFIVCPNSIDGNFNGHSLISNPNGQIIAGCLENLEMASMSKISINLARDKMIVPFTNAILNRQPVSYQLLTS